MTTVLVGRLSPPSDVQTVLRVSGRRFVAPAVPLEVIIFASGTVFALLTISTYGQMVAGEQYVDVTRQHLNNNIIVK